MSVMAETFQPAMGPYFATASVELVVLLDRRLQVGLAREHVS